MTRFWKAAARMGNWLNGTGAMDRGRGSSLSATDYSLALDPLAY